MLKSRKSSSFSLQISCHDFLPHVISDAVGSTCYLEETGCLFNLDTDPSELNDVGDEHSELREYFMKRLDYYSNRAPRNLMTFDERMSFDAFSPLMNCDSDFWCPFMEYDGALFEDTLQAEYQRIAGERKVCASS